VLAFAKADADLEERFERWMQAVARVANPNIVQAWTPANRREAVLSVRN